MIYLTGEEILVIHSEIIDQTGGSHGIRDIGLLQSIVEKPKMQFGGNELYEGCFLKAAVYLESITNYHVFVDGNKRTAVAGAARFLFLNGFELRATNKALEKFALEVATQKLSFKTITSWLKCHSKPI